jgi:hypothetical protein
MSLSRCHAEKHCLDEFLVAQRPVVGFCERVEITRPTPTLAAQRGSGSDIVSPCTTVMAGWMPFATANRKLTRAS